MGCCLGTAAATNHLQPPQLKAQPTAASLPPAFEEETVKEVLSETPIVPKNPSPSKTAPVNHPEILQSEEGKIESGADGGVDLTKTPTGEIQENDSEMYSYSESFSAATTATVADKKDEIEMDEDDEVTQKVKNRSPPAKRVPRKRPAVSSGELTGRKDRAIRPSARRQTIPSPEKKAQLPSRTTTNAQRHRNVGPSNDSRREVSGRRSRSPAVRGEAGQRREVRARSPAEKSSDIIPAKVVENEGKGMVEEGGASPEPQTSESLENPLVSLECFIFL
ncbi:uncharacterized protein LOC112523911 [Cynara cardunculus var. scolymus]|uniref:uncharacterized protein LOC112523911 n=1 Tax=Cynara cardunculus var. scolymus TaxID=59895 RepID=UPI000D62F075|nr:uncharacterized protein LOC112523911 [Cynara cardunculus var. scolymus]